MSPLPMTLLSLVLPGLALAGEECGKPAISPMSDTKILNGEEAAPHSFPWQVIIRRSVRGQHGKSKWPKPV